MRRLIFALALMLGAIGSAGSAHAQRTLLTGNVNYYVNCSTGSNANPGTSGSPFADPVYAYNLAQRTLDLAGYQVVVNLQSSCTLSGPWTFNGPLVGARGPDGFVISGSGSGTVVTGAASAATFYSVNGGEVYVTNLTITPGSAGTGFLVASPLQMKVQTVWMNTNGANALLDVAGSGAGIWASGLAVMAYGSCANTVAIAEDGGWINVTGAWGGGSTPCWNNAFVQADISSVIDLTGFSWSGGSSGPKANAIMNGTVFTNGMGLGALPGTSAGATSTGGQVN